jgi:hypothetical protein
MKVVHATFFSKTVPTKTVPTPFPVSTAEHSLKKILIIILWKQLSS